MLSVDQVEEIKSQAFLNKPSFLPHICKIYPKTVSEIIEMGQSHYQGILGTLLLDEIKIAKIVKEKTGEDVPLETIQPLKYLLDSADQDERFSLELKSMFSTFIKEDILFLPKISSILVGPPSEKRLITKNNFKDFQDILCIQNHREVKAAPPENESDWDRKMRLYHEQVAEIKKKKAKEKGEDGRSMSELLEIATIFGIDIDNCTFYAFYQLLRRYQAKEKWEQDLQMLCAGADSKKIKTKYWGESLTDE